MKQKRVGQQKAIDGVEDRQEMIEGQAVLQKRRSSALSVTQFVQDTVQLIQKSQKEMVWNKTRSTLP